MNENFAVFVAPGARPDAAGTRTDPLGSINAALAMAKASSKRVYVCAGTFREAVTVLRGIPLIGGFDCSVATWPLSLSKTRLEAPTSPALRAEGVDIPTRVDGFEIVAPAATAASVTSIGLLAKNAPKLTIAGSIIRSGPGFDGAAGTEGAQLTFSQTAPQSGVPRWCSGGCVGDAVSNKPANVGGAGAMGTCAGAADKNGGAGGAGGTGGDFVALVCEGNFCAVPRPLVWYNRKYNPVLGAYVAGKPPEAGTTGLGNDAVAGVDGESAKTSGTFTPEGYQPADGKAGGDGGPGKGGNGGAGGSMVGTPTGAGQEGQSATGSGGGAGGCPGLAGTPGKGGGASVGALISASAGLTLEGVQIYAAAGGAGGKGTFGSSATAGGPPGAVQAGAGAAQSGQAGGRSGVSGSGAGGHSVGIAHTGGEPTLVKGTTVKAGAAGPAVPEETKPDALGNVRTLAASAAGVASDLLPF